MSRSNAAVNKIQAKNQDTGAALVKQVKTLSLNYPKDLLKVGELTESVFDEWDKLRMQFRKQLARGNKSCLGLYDKLAAEEQLVVGLLAILNDKVIDFIVDDC